MAMFENPIAPRQRLNTFTFDAPTKEEATTGKDFMAGGSDYGVGFNQPTGKFKARGMDKGPIPMESRRHDPRDI